MVLESKVLVSTNLDLFIMLSYSIMITVDYLTDYFNSITEWCVINLEEGSWALTDLIKVKDSTHNEMIFSRTISFNRLEDATAFKLRFGRI